MVQCVLDFLVRIC
uniref:Uncharacterized protein n=1 Tax=Rhizophora mucronata TaxID=61149 RepID=A0A2P2PQ40_RHIMU